MSDRETEQARLRKAARKAIELWQRECWPGNLMENVVPKQQRAMIALLDAMDAFQAAQEKGDE